MPDDSNTNVWTYLLPSLVFHSTICVLAVARCIHWGRHGYGASRVMGVLIRDSATYFGGFCVVTIVNMVIWASARVRMLLFGLYIHNAAIMLTILTRSS